MLSVDAMITVAAIAMFLLVFTAIRGWLAAAAARSAAAAASMIAS